MAAASNSFLLTSTPNSTLPVISSPIGRSLRIIDDKKRLKTPRNLTVFAKTANPFSSFRLGKPTGGEDEAGDVESTKANPFEFNWGKISEVTSLIPVVGKSPALAGSGRRKDAGTVFVAGATGQLGARIAQMLLRGGFRVRAGVPDIGSAQELARFASQYKIISTEDLKRLNAVESTFEGAESMAKAIGNASKVVVTIGSTEKGPTSEVTTSDALLVVEAAQLAGVSHLAIIYDESSSTASPSNVLNGISNFFSNLFSKSQPLSIDEFLDKIIRTDLKYTLIKTTLTDDFSPDSNYNVVVASEGRVGENDYKVGRSQMAELVAKVFSNTGIAEDKVVEVYTDPSASVRSVDELFSVIPVDERRKVYTEAIAKAKAEEEAIKAAEEATKTAKEAQEAAEAKRKLEGEMKRLTDEETRTASLAKSAKQKAEETGTLVNGLFKNRAKEIGVGFSWENIGSQLSNAVKTVNIPTPKVQVATVGGQAKARNLPFQKAVVKQTSVQTKLKPKSKPVKSEEKAEKPKVNNIFGGMFKQETIYMDED